MPVDMGWNEIAGFALAIAVSGVVSGLLAGIFGIGGGAVVVPVFYQVFGLFGVDESVSMHLSVGSSLAIIIPTSIRSLLGHRARGVVDMDLLHSFAASSGGRRRARLDRGGLHFERRPAADLCGLRACSSASACSSTAKAGGSARSFPGIPGDRSPATVIGFFSTLMGIGGGIMNNTFMTLYGRPIHQAVATSSGVGALIAIPGTIGYIWAGWGKPGLPLASTGYVNWIAVALVIPIALIITPYGVRIAHALSRRHLEIGFGLFCLFVSARFFVSLYG